MQTRIKMLVARQLKAFKIKDFHIHVVNVSHKHAAHFDGNGETHFDVTVTSPKLSELKPLHRHTILNTSTANLVRDNHIHAISFKVKK